MNLFDLLKHRIEKSPSSQLLLKTLTFAFPMERRPSMESASASKYIIFCSVLSCFYETRPIRTVDVYDVLIKYFHRLRK
jgi:hypothetical protein